MASRQALDHGTARDIRSEKYTKKQTNFYAFMILVPSFLPNCEHGQKTPSSFSLAWDSHNSLIMAELHFYNLKKPKEQTTYGPN